MPILRTPTERFVDALSDLFGTTLSDEQRAHLEDAFNDAVEARVERMRERERQSEDW